MVIGIIFIGMVIYFVLEGIIAVSWKISMLLPWNGEICWD